MSENKCPKCGASISENKQYCPHCGARLSLAIETPIIIEEKQELSPKTKKILRIAGISAAAFAVIGTTIGLLVPFVFVPNAQISEVKKGNIFSFNEIGDSYSVRANPNLKKYFSEYLPSEITIPSEYKGRPVTEIENQAFRYCKKLTSVTIPNSVTSIGEGAFRYCTSLESITLPFVGESATSHQHLSYIFGLDDGDHGFSLVPESLKEVIISDGCDSLGDYAFSGCDSLTSITIPNGVTSIGEEAFYSCSSLTSITIPNGVTSIGDQAFYNCSSLTSITVPNSITSIGNYVFYECVNLDKVFYTGSETEWSSISVGSGNNKLKNSVYFYSEEEPTESGNYWHYVDDVPTIWLN